MSFKTSIQKSSRKAPKTFVNSEEFNLSDNSQLLFYPDVKLYVSCIPYDFTQAKLFDAFQQFGKVKNCYICNDHRRGEHLFGFVIFYEKESALKAAQMKNINIGPYTLKVKPTKEKPANILKKTSPKEQRRCIPKKKKTHKIHIAAKEIEGGSSRLVWTSRFGQNAVLSENIEARGNSNLAYSPNFNDFKDCHPQSSLINPYWSPIEEETRFIKSLRLTFMVKQNHTKDNTFFRKAGHIMNSQTDIQQEQGISFLNHELNHSNGVSSWSSSAYQLRDEDIGGSSSQHLSTVHRCMKSTPLCLCSSHYN